MFSSRFIWDLTANRLSAALETKRAAGIEVIDLTESNPTHAGFDDDGKEILAALAQPQSLRYDPDPRGLLSARQAVAAYYAECGEAIRPEQIHLTASTSEGYAYLFKLLANPGDEVLVPHPSYPLLDFLAALESVHLIRYPLEYDDNAGWRINMEALAASVSTKTKAIVLVNPNNPTGSFIKKTELQELNELCAQHHLALIVDEVFSDYGDGNDPQRVKSLVGNRDSLTFVLSGLSKIAGLPQMKLGWIHASGPETLRAEARERLDFIADTYLSVGAPVQHATAKLLALRHSLQGQIIRRIHANDAYLREQCSKLSDGRVLRMEGGWYAILEISKKFSEEEWALALLEEDNVLIHPGYFFDFPREGFMVLSLLTPPIIFQQGISKIISRLAKL